MKTRPPAPYASALSIWHRSNVGALEPQRGSDGITSVHPPTPPTRITAATCAASSSNENAENAHPAPPPTAPDPHAYRPKPAADTRPNPHTPIATVLELHHIDHLPVGIVTGVKPITLERAVFPPQPANAAAMICRSNRSRAALKLSPSTAATALRATHAYGAILQPDAP